MMKALHFQIYYQLDVELLKIIERVALPYNHLRMFKVICQHIFNILITSIIIYCVAYPTTNK
jgi:hypothetical protein